MLKKMMVLLFTSAVSIAYMEVYADIGTTSISTASQIATSSKANVAAPTMKLAVNDVMQMPNANERRVTDKKTQANESSDAISKIPAQAWLILTALVCFVMRSSRRIV